LRQAAAAGDGASARALALRFADAARALLALAPWRALFAPSPGSDDEGDAACEARVRAAHARGRGAAGAPWRPGPPRCSLAAPVLDGRGRMSAPAGSRRPAAICRSLCVIG